jgi:hypothetical protein
MRPLTPDGLLQWLVGPGLESSDGHCLSWSNSARTGYPYPEVSGLLLHLLSLTGRAPARRERLWRALVREREQAPAIRRGGQTYTFDTAMVLRGMLAHDEAILRAAAGPSAGQAEMAEPAAAAGECAARGWASLVIQAARQRNPAGVSRPPVRLAADTRWSLAFGAHQAKVCGALLQAGRRFGSLPGLDEAVGACAAAALDVQADDGRFRIHAASSMTYVHSHCYAVEGLLIRAAAGTAGTPEQVVAGAEWLAVAQQPGGGLRAWHDGRTASGPLRADATAQAMRIWLLVDRDRFARETACAGAFLGRLASPAQGLRYEPGSADVNAWGTIFAVQALGWGADPASADAAQIV